MSKKHDAMDKLRKAHKDMKVQKKAKTPAKEYLNKKKFKSASNFSTGE